METKCLPDFQISNYKTQSPKTARYLDKEDVPSRVLTTSSIQELLEPRNTLAEKEFQHIISNTETKLVHLIIIQCHQVQVSVEPIMVRVARIQE